MSSDLSTYADWSNQQSLIALFTGPNQLSKSKPY